MSESDRVAQVASLLERSILSGKFAPGDPLPSERAFSARLGVSRSVIREALGCLAVQGLVKTRHGSGTRVEVPSGRPVSNSLRQLFQRGDFRLEDVSAVRMPLETTIAALAATYRRSEHLSLMEKTQKVIGNPRRSLKSYIQADCDFHAALADASGNPIFNIILAPIQELLVESRRRTIGLHGAEVVYELHGRILAAVAARDGAEAARAMKEHLELSIKQLADFQSRSLQSTSRLR